MPPPTQPDPPDARDILKPGPAKNEAVGALQPGKPAAIEAGGWGRESVLRHTIGWFDFDAITEQEAFAEGAGGENKKDAAFPLSEEAALLRRLASLLQPPAAPLELPDGLLEWPAALLPYQREGVLALLSHPSLLLADSMGLGKTVQAIAALRILYTRRSIQSALVVCPASLVRQWQGEFRRWAPELRVAAVAGNPFDRGHLWQTPAHVKLVSYETLRADVLNLPDSPVLKAPWGVVILDEASRIKNRRSDVSVACRMLPRERAWALTGTPLENSVEDIVSLLDFLLSEPDYPVLIPSAPEALRSLLHTHQLRRRKEDVLSELPEKRLNEVTVELLPRQREAYDRAEQEGLVQLVKAQESLTIVHILELISRLKQLCNFDPVSGESAKMADISERMKELVEEGQRALVFSQFTDDTFGLARAARALQEFQPLLFTGSLSQAQRAKVIERFLKDTRHKALLLSLKAGAQGLNLQAASYVFHLDRWWNPAIEEQADSRAHRMGQTYPVTVYRYICADTIEERIAEVLAGKRKQFQEMVDDVSLDLAGSLSEKELFGLVGLPR